MPIPGRSYQILHDSSYRYAFNGKLHDDDIYGKDNSYDYGMRMYDPRLGRFMSTDPLFKKFPMLSPYQYASDNPIRYIDMDGLEGTQNSNGFNAPVVPDDGPYGVEGKDYDSHLNNLEAMHGMSDFGGQAYGGYIFFDPKQPEDNNSHGGYILVKNLTVVTTYTIEVTVNDYQDKVTRGVAAHTESKVVKTLNGGNSALSNDARDLKRSGVDFDRIIVIVKDPKDLSIAQQVAAAVTQKTGIPATAKVDKTINVNQKNQFIKDVHVNKTEDKHTKVLKGTHKEIQTKTKTQTYNAYKQ